MNHEDLFNDKLIDLEAKNIEIVPQGNKMSGFTRQVVDYLKSRWGSIAAVLVIIALLFVILVIIFFDTY